MGSSGPTLREPFGPLIDHGIEAELVADIPAVPTGNPIRLVSRDESVDAG
jgi:hypothetical protein